VGHAQVEVGVAVLGGDKDCAEERLGVGEGEQDGAFLLRGEDEFGAGVEEVGEVAGWGGRYRWGSFSSMTRSERSSLQVLRSCTTVDMLSQSRRTASDRAATFTQMFHTA
jgi:hypothetical protein